MKLIRTDHVRPGDLILGTKASGNYPAPRRVEAVRPAPEESKRMAAYWLVWSGGDGQNCYYGDTEVWLGRRP